jgi:hypothetical protein
MFWRMRLEALKFPTKKEDESSRRCGTTKKHQIAPSIKIFELTPGILLIPATTWSIR